MYLWNTNSGHLTCSWGREFDTIFRTPVQPHFGLVGLCNESRAVENLARYFRISVSGNDRQAGRKDSQLGARRWCHSSPDRPHSPRACSLFQALCQWRIEKTRRRRVGSRPLFFSPGSRSPLIPLVARSLFRSSSLTESLEQVEEKFKKYVKLGEKEIAHVFQ